MTVPFEPDQAVQLAAWLSHPDRAIASTEAKPRAPGWGTPTVRAVRLKCDTEQDWLAARLGGVGASEIGVIMGVSSWSSPYALWWRKRLDWRFPRTEAQRWGHLVEDPIAELFAEQHDELFVAKPAGAPYSLWAHPVHQWMLCTPDRLAVDDAGRVVPVELKSDEGGPGWGEPGSDEVPEHHRLQSMWQSHIFGSHGGWVVRKRSSGKGRVVPYWIPCDPNVVADMIDAAGAFLDSIERGQEPEPDGSRSTTETLKEINPAIDAGEVADVPEKLRSEWLAARRERNAAKAKESLMSNQLRAAMGRAEFAAVDGFVFARRSIGKRRGYTVDAGMVDELRGIGGQLDTPGELPGPLPSQGDIEGGGGGTPDSGADRPAAPPTEEEGPSGGGGPGVVVAQPEDQGGAEMTNKGE
jgi:putative phage-type endonuclease